MSVTLKNLLAIALASAGGANCAHAEQSTGSETAAPTEATPISIVCGYFGDHPPLTNPAQQPPVVMPPHDGITTPVEHYTLFEVVNTEAGQIVKAYDLPASGPTPVEAMLRSSIIGLMNFGEEYCVTGKLTGAHKLLMNRVEKAAP